MGVASCFQNGWSGVLKTLTFAEAVDLIKKQAQDREDARRKAADRERRENDSYHCSLCPHDHGDCADHA